MIKTVIAALALTLTPITALAQDVAYSQDAQASSVLEKRAGDVISLFKDEIEAQDLFTQRFLAAVPETELNGLITSLTAQFGPVVDVVEVTPKSATEAKIVLRFDRALGTGTIVISPDAPNKIEGLLLRTFDPIDDTAEKIRAELEALPGDVSVYFGPIDGNDARIAINPNKQMAIGSTFKVYLLSALTRKIQAGEAYWNDMGSPLERSYPSGMMQDWPDPAPVTLQTLATMMISISDNTATDTLLSYLGEDVVIDEMIASGHSQPQRNIPFIGTRHLFKLKGSGDALMDNYRAQNVDGKRAILGQLDNTHFDSGTVERAFADGPIALDIEWFASAHDLRRMLIHIPKTGHQVPLKIMAINPSASDNAFANYPRIYYKGGSEPGVLNFTYLLADKRGNWHVLAMSWNNPSANLDETVFELLGQRILALSVQ